MSLFASLTLNSSPLLPGVCNFQIIFNPYLCFLKSHLYSNKASEVQNQSGSSWSCVWISYQGRLPQMFLNIYFLVCNFFFPQHSSKLFKDQYWSTHHTYTDLIMLVLQKAHSLEFCSCCHLHPTPLDLNGSEDVRGTYITHPFIQ